MATFIDLLPVPGDILELVKARILANRKRNKKPEAKPAPKTARRRYYSELAPDRRPEPAGIPLRSGQTGLAWVAIDDLGGGFNSAFLWRHALTQAKLITDDGRFSFKVGCGDGSKWIDAHVTLPGIAAYRDFRESYFTPFARDQISIGVLDLLWFSSDPVGKFIPYITRDGFADDTRYRYFAFPCGNGSCILIVHVRAAGSRGATVSRAIRADRGESDVFGEFWRVLKSPFYIEQVDLKRHNISVTDVAAFVVSQTDCRQISVPSALRSALDTLLPDANWAGAPSGITSGLTPDYLSYNAATSEYWTEQYGVHYRKFDAFDFRREIMSFGMSSDVMEMEAPFHQVPPVSYSPSLFPMLTQYPSLLPALSAYYDTDYDNDPSYLEVGDLLRELGVPAPRDIVGFDARDQAYLDFSTAVYENAPGYDGPTGSSAAYTYLDPDRLLSSIRVVRTNAQPEQPFGQLPQSRSWSQVARLPLSSSRTVPYSSPRASYDVIWHYDWGKPAYCRQQLLALGFTAADLTP